MRAGLGEKRLSAPVLDWRRMSKYIKPPRPENTGLAVASLVVVSIVSALGMSIPNVAQPLISDDFAVSVSATQWVSLSYLLLSSLLVVPAGRLADSVGRVKVLLAGVIVFTAASLAAGLAPTLVTLSIARGIMGIGGAAMMSLPVALVRQTVATNRVGRTMGLIGSSMAAGWALGPAFGGMLAAAVGWRWVFLVLVPLGMVALALSLIALPRRTGGTGLPFTSDFWGLVVLAVALTSYSVGLTLRPGGFAGTVGLVALGVVALVLFVLLELRVENPLVNFRLLHEVRVYPGLITAFFASVIMMTFTVIPPFYLSRGLELSPEYVGVAMAVGPLVAVVAGVPSGWLVERFGSRPVFIGGLGLLTTASVAFATLPPTFGLVGFLISAVMLTPGNQMFMAANNTHVMAQSGAAHQGAVAGVLNLSRSLGSITGVAIAAPIFDAAVARVAGPWGATMGLQAAFGVAAVLGAVAFLVAWRSDRDA